LAVRFTILSTLWQGDRLPHEEGFRFFCSQAQKISAKGHVTGKLIVSIA
jgi:hypothetical protein